MIAIPAMNIFFLKHSLLLSAQLFSRTFTYFMYFSAQDISDSLENSSAGRIGFCAWWLRIPEEYKGPGFVKKIEIHLHTPVP